MAIFTKSIIAGIAGTVALGAMITWDGGTTVDSAKNKITEAATQIGVFKQNETALVSKVNTLKTEKATLTAEVAALKVELQVEKDKGVADKARIVELEAEIAAKNAQIAELETEISTLTEDLSNAAGNTTEITERINALEAELDAANEQAEELQYTLDTTVFAEPDQVAVDDAIGDTPGTNPVPPIGETKIAGAIDIGMLSDVPFFMMTGVTLDTVDGNVIIKNASDFVYTAVVNGQTFNITAAGTTIGNTVELDKHNLTIKSSGKADVNFWLINQ